MFAEELLPELLTDGSGHLGSVRWMDAHDVAGDAAIASIRIQIWESRRSLGVAIDLLGSAEDVQASVLRLGIRLLEQENFGNACCRHSMHHQ